MPGIASSPETASLSTTSVETTAAALTVTLADGRTLSVPLNWFPRLGYATAQERARVEIRDGALRWPDLDLDLDLAGLLAGYPSAESGASLAAWKAVMDQRRAQTASGLGPEPFAPALPLPDGWDDD